MMLLRVNSLSSHQLRSLRIHPSTLVPLSVPLLFTKFMTTGARLKVLAASGDGGKAIHSVVIRQSRSDASHLSKRYRLQREGTT
jgi:hypothetical protein